MEAFFGGRHGSKILFRGYNGTNLRLNEHTQSSDNLRLPHARIIHDAYKGLLAEYFTGPQQMAHLLLGKEFRQ